MKFSMTGQEKCVLLIQVTVWAGLTVYIVGKCTSFRNRQKSEPLTSMSSMFLSDSKLIQFLLTMVAHVCCIKHVYPAMSNCPKDLI